MSSRFLDDLDVTSGTGSSSVQKVERPVETMASITQQYGQLRDKTSILDADVGSEHRATQLHTLELLARDYARKDVSTLLANLSTWGLGWSDIGRMVGVSVQALRKWRRGQPASGENRMAVARLSAFLEMLERVPVQDPACWLEMPVVSGFRPRHLDLYRMQHPDVLLDLAHLRITPEQALDEVEPDWRTAWRLEHETFEADDGELSIRRRRAES